MWRLRHVTPSTMCPGGGAVLGPQDSRLGGVPAQLSSLFGGQLLPHPQRHGDLAGASGTPGERGSSERPRKLDGLKKFQISRGKQQDGAQKDCEMVSYGGSLV